MWLAAVWQWLIPLRNCWSDSATLSDPGINLITGHGFTSTTWARQSSSETLLVPPLFSILSGCWYAVFGVNHEQMFLFGAILGAAACAITTITCKRLRWVESSLTLCLLLAAMLCGKSMIFSMTVGRWDPLCMLIFSVAFFAFSFADGVRNRVLCVCSFLAPLSGFQNIGYGAVLWVFFRKFIGRFKFASRSLLLGLLAGGLLLCLSIAALGLLLKFLILTAATQELAVGQIGRLAVEHEDLFFTKYPIWAAARIADWSFDCIVLTLLFVAGYLRSKALLRLCFLLAILLPFTLTTLGKFPYYYGWMTYVPLLITGAYYAQRAKRNVRIAIQVSMFACALLGVAPSFSLETSNGQPKVIDHFVDQNWSGDKYVFADASAYMACKRRGAMVLIDQYCYSNWQNGIPQAEREAVTALIIKPGALAETRRRLGGDWVHVSTLPLSGDPLGLYRRR